MDTTVVGRRIKATRESLGITQEALAEMANISPTHISVIERGAKLPRLESFISIANALNVSADSLLLGVVTKSTTGVSSELAEMIATLPQREQNRILKVVRVLVEEY